MVRRRPNPTSLSLLRVLTALLAVVVLVGALIFFGLMVGDHLEDATGDDDDQDDGGTENNDTDDDTGAGNDTGSDDTDGNATTG